jgi:hypothetical protein
MLLFMVLWIIWVLRFLDTEAVTCQTKFLVYNPFGIPSCFMFVWSYSFSSCVWTIILLNGPLHVYLSFIIFKLRWNRNHGMADFMIKHKNQHIIIGESASVMLYKTVMCRDRQPLSISKQWSGNYILKLSPGRRPWKLLLLYRHLLTVSLSKYTNKSLDPKLARVSYVYPSAPFYIIIYKYQGKNVSGFIIIKEVQLKSTYISSIIYISSFCNHM